jgi:SAM-dependent methyltransferase
MNAAEHLKGSQAREVSAWAWLKDWFRSPSGRALLAAEHELAQELVQGLFGYYTVQLGLLHDCEYLTGTRTTHRFLFNIDPGDMSDPRERAVCLIDALPIASRSVDVVVVPHGLEFHPQPDLILNEIERILVGEGHILLFGFNPWSLWGLSRWLRGETEEAPWCGRFLSVPQVNYWLEQLGFEIVQNRGFYFRPPLKRARMVERLALMESIGARCWPYFGGAYAVVARKRLLGVTPLVVDWATRRTLSPIGVPVPSTCARLPAQSTAEHAPETGPDSVARAA